MDAPVNRNEIRLTKGKSLRDRLVLAGFAGLICLFSIPDLVAVTHGQWPGIGGIVALLFGCALLGAVILERHVVWIITPGEILIDEQRPSGPLHRRLIRSDEISEMHLQKHDIPSFLLAFKLHSGDILTSPPIPDVTRVHEIGSSIARLLALPDLDPAENPLDASNAAIRLGQPVESRRGAGHRVLIVLLTLVLSFPFVHALWNGELSALGIGVWSLGLIVAAVLFRYAYRMAGTFWIVRDGEIRVERLSLWGEPEAETLRGSDVETITVESGYTEDNRHVVAVRLRNGKKIRSPELAGRDEAEALRAEIARRLSASKVVTVSTG
ncbi:hypothetical protein [Afipia sp. GAS231]|uniref:hypothetical protein n=1 Tax=Afipia sp. GAS231 TaxID=1882747 RepID=UPI00087D9B15|nr:hypothetical protein [Afipia sp. GAS231]SDO39358.1 hypothetical protein SAMN05444050_4026 [Afipia sp. GAS231]